MTIYLDEFRVGREPCTYADIAPVGGQGAVEITTTSFGELTQGVESTGVLAASGGSGLYTWTAFDAPEGFTINIDGTWSITPEIYGDYNFSVTVTDSLLNTATKMFSGLVTPASAPDIPVILDFSMPGASDSLSVPVSSFIGDATVVGYMVTDNPAKPATGDDRWTGVPWTSVASTIKGLVRFYPHVRNSEGVVVTGTPATVVINTSEVIPGEPVVDSLVLQPGDKTLSIHTED